MLFLLSIFSSLLSAQINLVPNWSFEDTVSCPTGQTQINMATGWSSYKQTPDYFNNCNNGQVGNPINFAGYQYPKTGNAYSGFATYAKFTSEYREILGIQLLQSLNIGQQYYVSFYVNWTSHSLGNNINVSTNKIGARFTTVPYTTLSPVSIDNYSQVYTDSVISDTLNWTLISGFFTADSAYQYLSIGNFFTDAATTNILWDSIAAISYYYVDDITVVDSIPNDVEEYNSNKIKIFPNPARDWIVLEGKGIKSIEITNALGSTIGSYPTTAFTLRNSLNISSLCRGIYFLKINMIDERFLFQKLIIQN